MIIVAAKGTIIKDKAKNGYAKLKLNFDRMINQSMKPPAYKGMAIMIHGLLNIVSRMENVLYLSSKDVTSPTSRIPILRNTCPNVPIIGANKTNKKELMEFYFYSILKNFHIKIALSNFQSTE